MSDTKWLKTLRALSSVEKAITRLEWKFVDEARVYRTPVPQARDLAATRLKDGRFQPFEYRDVEWLDVVTSNEPVVQERFAACGRRLIESMPFGLRIVGYRKEPNQAPEPMPTSVTRRADARHAPAAGMAHL